MAEKKQKKGSTGAAEKKLNDREELFCHLYLKSFNAARAYQEAYGCGWPTAYTSGPAKRKEAHIAKRIDEMRAQRFAEIDIRKEDIIRKHAAIAFSDIGDFIEIRQDEKGLLRPVIKENADLSQVSEISYTDKVGGLKIRLADKQRSLEALERMLAPAEEAAESGVVLIPEVDGVE